MAIGEEISKGKSYMERIGPVKTVIGERLQQCKELLHRDEEAEG
ncbi:MAG: hypothetical protein ACRKFN_10215 [Desulfitobacterium sp.]